MGFVEASKTVFSKYATFSGRATRPEYWYFALFAFLTNLAATLVDLALGTHFGNGRGSGAFSSITSLALMIPHLAVGFRRLHDTEHSGWWLGGIFLSAVVAGLTIVFLKPLGAILFVVLGILTLLLLIWLCSAGTPGPNNYGPPPPTAVIPAPIVPE
jgi:uncharacterized membrane protein YhaH (DUF805 family)